MADCVSNTNTFKIVSVNVRGASDVVKRRALFDNYRVNADMLIMQETHSVKDQEKIWEKEWGGKALFAHGTSASRGVALFTSKEIYKRMSNIHLDEDGRMIMLDLYENDKIVTITAIYAPNQDCPHFFNNIAELLRSRQENKIIIGDFNFTMDVDKDRKNTYNNNNNSKEVVVNMAEEFSLREVWREQNQDVIQYSWFKGGKTQKASRIDFALVSGGMDQKVKTITYIPGIKTDHRAMYMCLDLDYNERGRGYWKLNTQLLKKKDYIDNLNKELLITLQSTEQKKPKERWEIIKTRIKKTTIEFSKQQVRQDKIIIANLLEKIDEYESNFPLEEDQNKILQKSKIDLEEKLLEKARGNIFRSKVKWYEEGERNTKYFFSLEKARYNAKTCYTMITENQQEVTDTYDILNHQRHFYQNLYEKDEDVEFSLKNNSNIRVPKEIKEEQNLQITIRDLEIAIKPMNNNKTPGEDGIPVDFYKVFWKILKGPFYEMVQQSYQEQTLHPTARKGILNLIPKPGKDSRYIKNLRPITLLNTDYKIIEKAIANKMIPALEHIINKDQRGFMKERRISVNIRKMLDIIEQAEKDDLEAIVLSLDFVKCFDKCSFSILHGSLIFYDFGEIVKEWTKILYDNFTVKIQNNGHFSQEIDINKGVHQGGCCSSVYFLVIAEILAMALRNNEDIEGLTIKDIRNLLNQFADDMDIFSICNEKSIKAIFSELENFKKQSGFTLSYEKTTLYRIGSLRHSSAQLYNLSQVAWSNQDITVLGTTISHQDVVQKNYQPLIEKTKRVLNAWYNRGLTLMGRVQVVNTLIASLFVYKMMVLPSIPDTIVKKIDNIIRSFLWDHKKAKISYKILQNPKKEGGLNLVNIKNKDKALKTTWPQILKEEQEYSKMVYGFLRCTEIGEDIWRVSLEKTDVKNLKIKNQFWENVLEAWCEYNYYLDRRIDNQIIWYNSSIRIKGKPFMWNDVYRKGLKYVYQLFTNKHFKSQEQVKKEFNLTILRYNSLKAALPAEWRTYFTNKEPITLHPIVPHNYDIAIYAEKKGLSGKAYKMLADDRTIIYNKYIKWKQEIEGGIAETLTEYALLHSKLYKITNVTKYRDFQYRLLQRGLVTNIQLHHWKIIEDPNCSFCKEQLETVPHLLALCPKVQDIWNNFAIYVNNNFGEQQLSLNVKNIMVNQISKRLVVNFLCLIVKQYIYAQKCLGNELDFTTCKAILIRTQAIEKYIALKNDKLQIHAKKWCNIISSEVDTPHDYIMEYNQESL